VKPSAFEYHAPLTPVAAVDLLAELGEGAKLLAGGQSLIPMLALRLTAFDHLIDIGRVGELKGIERRDGRLWVGAGTTEAAVEGSADVTSAVPLLARATPLIGHFQIRNRGTLARLAVRSRMLTLQPSIPRWR
jgi:carbon-monoxide dehydrogenase medium subunit